MAHFQNQYAASQIDEYGSPIRTDQFDEYGNPIRVDQYGNTVRTDEYGNPIRTDEYGNPIHHTAGTTAGYGAGGFDTTTPQGMRHDVTGTRGSEDDGHGGRRKKKGLAEKIKEKIPGVGNKDHRSNTSATTTQAYDEGELRQHEKKGVMEKIKEKLPGHHY
uniref:Dehydrin n=1 Tax=Betula platyphylla TaxID=78630 RepID=A0A125R6H2_BETPL|nr:dehydrin [Betula platyphylla]